MDTDIEMLNSLIGNDTIELENVTYEKVKSHLPCKDCALFRFCYTTDKVCCNDGDSIYKLKTIEHITPINANIEIKVDEFVYTMLKCGIPYSKCILCAFNDVCDDFKICTDVFKRNGYFKKL